MTFFPQYSIIVPVFDRHQYLREAVHSALNQTCRPYEVLLVTLGANQKVISIAKDLENENRIVRCILASSTNYQNNYLSTSRNIGIKLAKSDYLAFLDDDDIWEPNKIERQFNFLVNNPYDIVSCLTIEFSGTNVINRTPEQRKIYPDLKKSLIVDNYYSGGSQVLMKKEIFGNVGLFDESLISNEDHDMWRRISHKYHLGILDERLVQYRVSDNRLSSNRAKHIVGYLKHTSKILLQEDKYSEAVLLRVEHSIRNCRKLLLKNNVLFKIYTFPLYPLSYFKYKIFYSPVDVQKMLIKYINYNDQQRLLSKIFDIYVMLNLLKKFLKEKVLL